MAVASVGPVGFESIATPYGRAERQLGGAALHAGVAASFFARTRLVAEVGADFGEAHRAAIEATGLDTAGVVQADAAQSAWWRREYDVARELVDSDSGGEARLGHHTLSRALGAEDCGTVLLGPIDPSLQLAATRWVEGSRVGMTTSARWIRTSRPGVIEALQAADVVFLTVAEASALTGAVLVLDAAREIESWGPAVVVVDLADDGYAVLADGSYFSIPGRPVERVVDPTGTTSTFAGALLGYLDGEPALTLSVLRNAASYGAALASICAEDLGWDAVRTTSELELLRRASEFIPFTHFERETPMVAV